MRTTSKVRKKGIESTKKKEGDYSVASASMSVDDKLRVLEGIGRSDLVEIFKGWEPTQAKSRRKSAPLDQRVSITVTDDERVRLQEDLKDSKRHDEKVNMSQFIRHRAIGSVDINGWKEIATTALTEINEIDANRKEMAQRERFLRAEIEEEDDSEELGLMELELTKIRTRFHKIISQNRKRSQRLSGRMTMAEAETVKWRASRLCITTSDYLRFMIFDLLPDTDSDAHMSLDAKRRFYVSIIDVANNGWGEPPTIANCTQCTNYLEEIGRLKERIRQLEAFR